MLISQALGITVNEVVTVVGAGGKSSLLLSLAREWREQKRAFLLTATTNMFVQQIENYAPVFCSVYEDGVAQVLQRIVAHGYAAWFAGRVRAKGFGEKALGVEPGWIDRFYCQHKDRVSNIIIEGDGARGRLLKIPDAEEPVVPQSCHRVIGVMNLRAVGREISPEVIHRYELAVPFLGRNEGTILPPDLIALALHPQGIFKNRIAQKVVVLSGVDKDNKGMAAELAQALISSGSGFTSCVVTAGSGEGVVPVAIFRSKEHDNNPTQPR